ncbi:MAG: LysR family transcriptional regulator [Burkholderiaceae bacterium]
MACHVVGAGRLLGISQPAVSKSLSTLERRLGFALYARTPGGLVPTREAGRLVPEVERIFGSIERLDAMLAGIRKGDEGELRIAAVPSLALGLLAPAIAALAVSRPHLEISALTMLAQQVFDAVLTRRVELGFTFEAAQEPGLVSTLFEKRALVALVPRHHALAQHDVITVNDLASTTVIAFQANQPLGRALDEAFARRRKRARRRVEIGHSFLAWSLVAKGVGVAVVDPYILTALSGPDVLAKPFHPGLEISTYLTTQADIPHSVIARELVAIARSSGRGEKSSQPNPRSSRVRSGID